VNGVWVAYYPDSVGALVAFEEEVDCLRHAHTNAMSVVFLPFGQALRDAAAA
jgi:hypothetical protein